MGFVNVLVSQFRNVVRAYAQQVTSSSPDGTVDTREVMISRIGQEVMQITRTEYVPEPVRLEIERRVNLAIEQGRLEDLDPRVVAEQVLGASDLYEADTSATVQNTALDDDGAIDPERARELEAQVAEMDRPDDFINFMMADETLTPEEAAYATGLAVDRWPPDSGWYEGLHYGLLDVAASWPEGARAITNMLVDRALDPANTVPPEELTTTALAMAASDPALAAALVEDVGAARWPEVIASLHLDVAEEGANTDPNFYGVGSRSIVLASFLETLRALPPSEVQAQIVFASFQSAGYYALGDNELREELARGLADVFALGDETLAAAEGDRLAGLFDNRYILEALQAASPEEREQLVIALMSYGELTSDLIDEHHGNLATAIAYAQLGQVNDALTSSFLDGEVPLGPNGEPLITAEATIPDGVDLSDHPELAALGQPITVAAIEEAIAEGELSSADAAAFLRDLAAESTQLGDPDLSNYGANLFTEAALVFFNGGNPIEKSNFDDFANRDAQQLLALADAIENSDDPAFIAQAIVAGGAQHHIFLESLQPYGHAVNTMAAETQRNRVLTMLGVAVVASLALPIMAAAGLPAFGATGTIFGIGVTGSPFLSAALPAGISAVLSTTTNAAFQYEGNGTVSWGDAILGGTIDGLTSFFGATVAARAMQRGWGFGRTVLAAGSIDGAGGFGSYVLGTPGALEAILGGDSTQLNAALGQAGFNFLISMGFNGVTYRNNLGDVPPLGAATDYDANQTLMARLLDPDAVDSIFDGGVPVRGLNGEPITAAQLAGQTYESYFAVYRNPSTGEVLVQEVARARPGEPLALQAFDAVNGIRRNSPGQGWEVVGGFHNHPSGNGASAADFSVEPVFRGELGDGFASFVFDGTRGVSFGDTDTPPMTLAEAYSSARSVQMRDLSARDAQAILDRTSFPSGQQLLYNAQSLDPARINQLGLQPVRQVQVDGVTYSFSRPFELGGGRLGAVVYVESGGQVNAYFAYRSNSQAAWRIAPDGLGNADGVTWFGKGVAERDTQLPIPATATLTDMANSGMTLSGIDRSAWAPLVPMYGSTGYASSVGDELPFSIHGDSLPTGNPDYRVPDPAQVQLPADPLTWPDFSREVQTFTFQNPAYGNLTGDPSMTGHVFLSQDGSVRYLFVEDAEGRVALAGAELVGVAPSEFGLRPDYLDLDGMDAPLMEYGVQVPFQYGGSTSRDYMLNWNYVRELPIIELYYNQTGQTMPPALR